MNGLMKLMITTVTVITVGCAVAVLVVPPSPQERVVRRQGEAQRLIDQITQEVWNYKNEHGHFPPGDGIGTASLVHALQRPSRTGVPYMIFVPEMLNPVGDLKNPVDPESSILYYRNNCEGRGAAESVHNERSFDVWGRSVDGRRDGVNNWDSVVPSP